MLLCHCLMTPAWVMRGMTYICTVLTWLFTVSVRVCSQLCADGKTLLDTLETPVSSGSHNSLTAKADYSHARTRVLDKIHEVSDWVLRENKIHVLLKNKSFRAV